MIRDAARRRVSDALEGRELVWFGTRGEDVEAVADLPALRAAFSVIASHKRRMAVEGAALEDLTRVRVDLDAHDIDDEPRTEAVAELRRAMLRTLNRPSALFTYRPSTFVSAITFARAGRCRYLGLFKDHQAAFEHKPWVESELARLGLPHIPWTYVSDEEQLETLRFLEEGDVMLRRSRTSGGVGLARLDDANRLADLWPKQDEAMVSVAPFIGDAVPLNVAAVVWDDGVTLHPASVQLIGIPGLTRRPFGYCGNDFGAVAEFGQNAIDAVERSVRQIADWLRTYGYRGAFGADFLLTEEDVPLFTEVNPRFQGSTHLSCQISIEQHESCVMLDHLGALLGLPAPPSRSLWEMSRSIGDVAHFVAHAGAGVDREPAVLASEVAAQPSTTRVDIVVPRGVQAEASSAIYRATVRERLTTRGFDFPLRWQEIVGGTASGHKGRSD